MKTKMRSLSGTTFRAILVFSLSVMVLLSLVLTTIYYWSYEADAERELADQARDAAAYLNQTSSEENVPALEEQFAGVVRYTLIADDGTVLFDSATSDVAELENHSSRPEVMAADESGEGAVSRYSATLETDTIYAAVKLEDGSIVRLSETRASLISFLSTLMLPVLTVLVVTALLALLVSRLLVKRIMKPINALDLREPLENEIYEEMTPLLVRIDEQQRQLKEQNRELARAENMRRDFSANVSHEMKTPLQVIAGYAELMKGGLVPESDTKKIAGLIYDESQAMRQLINDVLTLSRLDESSFDAEADKPVNLRELADRVAGRLQPFAKERGISLVAAGDVVFMRGSEILIEEIIYNLVENGIRYNSEGGAVTLRVSRELVPYAEEGVSSPLASVQSSQLKRQDQVVVRVRDTGAGIPKEEQEKIFERFYRMEKSRSKETGGTGLGLAIVKHAVIQLGGTIEVESEVGEGTVFVLRFPAA